MRRPHWLVFSIAVPAMFASLMLAGCGGGDGPDGSIEEPDMSGMLRKVRSASELENSLKSSLPAALALAPPPAAGPADVGIAVGGVSATYTVEAGVDEFDFVRYDGTHLYVAPIPWSSSMSPREVRVLRTDPANGTATQVSSIPVPLNHIVHGLYVADGRLVMMTNEINYLPVINVWLGMFRWPPTELEIQVYNVADPAHPARILHAKVGGSLVATRRVGDRVYLVTRFSPYVPTDAAGNSLLSTMGLNDLLPKLVIDGNSRPLVAPSDCYVTNGGDSQGYPVLTTITSFSMQNPGAFSSACYNESANGIYASTTALYLTQPRNGAFPNGSATRIHKFSLGAVAPTYAGSAEISGNLWLGGQNDFRMNEQGGLLRVMTTEFTNDPLDPEDHRLFILRPKSGELALEVISSLPNSARPQELGKPNESLYGVRFTNDRAYAVTFRRIDPLYVLDLSNPVDPRIAGELVLPGFSDFLHPVTDDLLLGLGTDAGAIKLELFDVTTLEHPQSRGMLVLSPPNSYSEALWDRHAFTWLPAVTADRVAVPVTRYPLTATDPIEQPLTSLHQVEILGKQSAGSASLQAVGVVSPPGYDSDSTWSTSSRSFIHGDTVYFVRGEVVWSTSWFAPSQIRGPF